MRRPPFCRVVVGGVERRFLGIGMLSGAEHLFLYKKNPKYQISVPLNLTFRSAFFVYQHIRRSLNDCGSRQSILKFRTALESPFHFQCNTAIPPPAALCENTIENVLLFLNGFSCLVMGIIVRKGLFVKKNNKKSLETCKLCRAERKMVISKKNITFQKLP